MERAECRPWGRGWWVIVGIALMTAASSRASAREPVELRYKYREGDIIKQRVSTEQKDVVTGGPLAGTKYADSRIMEVRMTVRDVAPTGTATIEAVVERLRMDMEGPWAGKLSYDSSKPDADRSAHPLAASLGAMVDEPFVLVMDETGAITDVRELEKITAKIARGGGGRRNPAGGTDRAFGPDMIRTMFALGAVLPRAAVSVGGDWNADSEVELPMLGAVRLRTVSVLKGVREIDASRVAEVETSGTLELGPPEPNGASGPKRPRPAIKQGSVALKVWFDVGKGRLIKAVSTREAQFSITLDDGDRRLTTAQSRTVKATVEDITDRRD